MRAVILAGGKGTRLRPYTLVLPKPLIPVGDVPVIESLLKWLRRNGIRNMPLIKELREDIWDYIETHGLTSKWEKAKALFEENPSDVVPLAVATLFPLAHENPCLFSSVLTQR